MGKGSMGKGHRGKRTGMGREEAEAAIREHAEGLKEELNLRLVCMGAEKPAEDHILLELLKQAGKTALWGELCISESILWVDEVLIMEIAYGRGRREGKAGKGGFPAWLRRVFAYLGRLFFRRGVKTR